MSQTYLQQKASRPKFTTDQWRPFYDSTTASSRVKTYEVNTLPSETIPDDSFTMREIYTRFTSGYPINVHNYTGDLEEDLDSPYATVQWKHIDLAEREQLIKEIKEKQLEAKQRYDDAVKESVKRKNKAAFERAVKAQLAASKKPEKVEKADQDS